MARRSPPHPLLGLRLGSRSWLLGGRGALAGRAVCGESAGREPPRSSAAHPPIHRGLTHPSSAWRTGAEQAGKVRMSPSWWLSGSVSFSCPDQCLIRSGVVHRARGCAWDLGLCTGPVHRTWSCAWDPRSCTGSGCVRGPGCAQGQGRGGGNPRLLFPEE